jgi:hypothetical protein
MATQQATGAVEAPPPFQFKLITPYSTRINGEAAPVPYVIDGLLTQSGFSVLAARPKQGKSSISRYAAVCVAKGVPFLGRQTTLGEAILISLEDPSFHVDNCLEALGYVQGTDAPIHIIEKLSHNTDENFDRLAELLAKMPDVRLVVVDTLAKLIRVTDLNDYMPVMTGVERLRNLARLFPKLHVQALAHCKKVRTDDVFDGLLGSTALRGEPDTNIVLYEQDRKRIIATETRIGRNLADTIINADLVDIAGAQVVANFSLGQSLDDYQSLKSEAQDIKQKLSYEQKIIDFLKSSDGLTAPLEFVIRNLTGRKENLRTAVATLEAAGVVSFTGKKQSPTDPLKVTLDPEAARINEFLSRFAG